MACNGVGCGGGVFTAKAQSRKETQNGMLKFDIGRWAFDIKARYNCTFEGHTFVRDVNF